MPQSSARLKPDDRRIVALLRMGPFERRDRGWRFGAKRITDTVVNRLIGAGVAVREGNVVRMLQAGGPLDRFTFATFPDGVGQGPHASGLDPLSRTGNHLPELTHHDVAPNLSPDEALVGSLTRLSAL